MITPSPYLFRCILGGKCYCELVKKELNISKRGVADPMRVISLEEYRKSHKPHKIKLTKEQISERLRPTLKALLKAKLRIRLRERMRLQELEEKQSKPPTTKKT